MDNVKEAKAPFEITDDNAANWAFRKLAEANKQLADVKKQKEAFDEQTKDWYESESKPILESVNYFQQLIERYRLTKPDGKVKVPAGYTQVRHTKDYQRNAGELLPFIEKNYPDYIKKDIKWGDFKKRIKDHSGIAIDPNGQVIPGIHIAEKESVSYKTNKIGDEL